MLLKLGQWFELEVAILAVYIRVGRREAYVGRSAGLWVAHLD